MRTAFITLLAVAILAGAAYSQESSSMTMGTLSLSSGRSISVSRDIYGRNGDHFVTVCASKYGVPYVAVLNPHEAQQLAVMLEAAWRRLSSASVNSDLCVGGVSGIGVYAVNEAGSRFVSVVVHDGITCSVIFYNYSDVQKLASYLRRAAQ